MLISTELFESITGRQGSVAFSKSLKQKKLCGVSMLLLYVFLIVHRRQFDSWDFWCRLVTVICQVSLILLVCRFYDDICLLQMMNI